jgi:uncharacterized protein YkwD
MRLLASLLVVIVFAVSAAAEEPKLTNDEKALIDLTNEARAKQKLPSLKVNALLMKAAANHSANMVRQGKQEHILDGKDVEDRIKEVGYKPRACAENLCQEIDPRSAVKAWMASKAHRETILDPDYEEIGVALVRDPRKPKVWYMTQVFGTPKKK